MKNVMTIAVLIVSLVFAPNAWASCSFCSCDDLPNGSFGSSGSGWTFDYWTGTNNATFVANADLCGFTGLENLARLQYAGSRVKTSSAFTAGTGNVWSVQFTAYVPGYTGASAYDHIRVIITDDLNRSEEFTAYFNSMTQCFKVFSQTLAYDYDGRSVNVSFQKSQYSNMDVHIDFAGFHRTTC